MRGVVFAGALLACLTVTAPVFAADPVPLSAEVAATLSPNSFVWQDTNTGESVRVVVSIPDQRAYAYRGAALIGIATVSTGKEGKDTPIGSYPILQKNKDHKSNLYNAAPMPYMQRLTWDGIALHAGRNPGFPDSHGCVRLPTGFAKALFGVTDLGSTVDVVDYAVDPSTAPASLVPADVVAAADRETVRANRQQLASLDR